MKKGGGERIVIITLLQYESAYGTQERTLNMHKEGTGSSVSAGKGCMHAARRQDDRIPMCARKT